MRSSERRRPTEQSSALTVTDADAGRQDARVPLARRLLASLATVAAAGALMLFGTVGEFTAENAGITAHDAGRRSALSAWLWQRRKLRG